MRNAWTLHPASECHGTYCKRARNTEFSSTGVDRGRKPAESAARGAGNCRDGEWCTNGGRKRQTGTVFGNDADRAGVRERRSDPIEFNRGGGAIAFPDERENEEGSGLPGSEVEDLSQRERLCGIGIYGTGSGILGDAVSWGSSNGSGGERFSTRRRRAG